MRLEQNQMEAQRAADTNNLSDIHHIAKRHTHSTASRADAGGSETRAGWSGGCRRSARLTRGALVGPSRRPPELRCSARHGEHLRRGHHSDAALRSALDEAALLLGTNCGVGGCPAVRPTAFARETARTLWNLLEQRVGAKEPSWKVGTVFCNIRRKICSFR